MVTNPAGCPSLSYPVSTSVTVTFEGDEGRGEDDRFEARLEEEIKGRRWIEDSVEPQQL
jgi:hypothetical protein